MKVSIRDLSKITGFSPATISNALNHKKGVNRETAEEIFRVARETGYLNANAVTKIRLLIFKKNGQIIEDTPFFQSLIEGFEEECHRLGYEMVISRADQREADYENQVKELLHEQGSAVVVLATEMMDGDLEPFRNAPCPLILLDHWSESMEFNAVLINNADAARMMTEHLLNYGHKEIGYLKGSFRIKGFRSRYVGFLTALRKKKIPYREEYTVTLGTSLNDAYQDMLKYLEKNPVLPTAYFADNDMIALGAMKALQEKGYRIPEDVSIVGFDDLPFSEISSPGLTTLRVPNREMGKMAVRRAAELIEGIAADAVTKTQVCPKIVYRDTVKRILE
ncbi:MAG TPA: substrate-binding domain-containing protein [Candidatus Blautia faecavium]|uniref:Substrate-binding domain-containing protein n=1 Tax=Candidatus Blautia faecavium TaxID=2838487 RepID=A0A9D2LUX3_9FIRM|nr:substrate-binding domain-containing protein [Candidatus Blautia faecavium]